jgi:hypothetical protein
MLIFCIEHRVFLRRESIETKISMRESFKMSLALNWNDFCHTGLDRKWKHVAFGRKTRREAENQKFLSHSINL